MNRILLVDTLNSAFYLKHSKESNVVWKFIEDIREVANRFKIDQVVFVYEGVGGSRYRKELYPEYKWKRKELREKSSEADKKAFSVFIKQVDQLIKIAPMFGIKTLNVDGAEADDTIAYFLNIIDTTDNQILLLSSDTDLNQLLKENVVQGTYGKDMVAGIRSGKIPASIFMNHKEFLKESQLTPIMYAESKSLSGDTADSIAGFEGLGEKLAKDLIVKYGNIENIKKNLDTLSVPRLRKSSVEHMQRDFDLVYRNFKLINLNWGSETYEEILGKDGCLKVINFVVDLLKPLPINKKAIEELCYEHGRIDIVDKLDYFLFPFGGVHVS